MKVETLTPIPPKSNPYNYDRDNVGIVVGTNCVIMAPGLRSDFVNYIIVVNRITGERIKVTLKENPIIQP